MIATGGVVAEVLELFDAAGSKVLAVVRHAAENIATFFAGWPTRGRKQSALYVGALLVLFRASLRGC